MQGGGDKNINRHYMMKSVGLQNTTEEKDFGVWISNDLKASFHVAKAVSKANQTLELIRRTFTHLDCQLMNQVVCGTCQATSGVRKCGMAFLPEEGHAATDT